jgi:hypothetical protein
MIQDGFSRCADDITVGIDPDIYSYIWDDFAAPPAGVRVEIALSAARRGDAIEMSPIVRDVGLEWDRIIRSLRPALPV